jgi:hypothetical protein
MSVVLGEARWLRRRIEAHRGLTLVDSTLL